jgi:hypothetical protein
MLHPAGPGKYLAELLLGDTAHVSIVVENKGPGTCGSLIKGKDEAHLVSFPKS